MKENSREDDADNVIPITTMKKPQDEEKTLTRKWGKTTMDANYTVLPSALVRGQERLGINANEFAVLVHLLDHWWEAEKMPFPTKKTIAARLQVSDKTVQRALVQLEAGGLLKRNARYNPKTNGRTSNEYDLSPLVAKLTEISRDMISASKTAREAKKKAERPKWKTSNNKRKVGA